MQATAHTLLSNTVPEVRLEHNGESLSFSISVFQRANFQSEYDVFDYINRFWSSLRPELQDEIFGIYKQIQYGFETLLSKKDLFDFLQVKVAELLEAHNLENVQNWIAYSSDINVPDRFDQEYSYSLDNNTSREKTYTRGDYSKLVALSVLLRCMVPVWGEYISNIRQEAGTMYKELDAFQLINRSKVSRCEAIHKLHVYIVNIVGADNSDPNNILNGICAEDFGYYILALTCIRRLCIGDVRGTTEGTNLITYIYKYIIQRIRNGDNNYENVVKEKKFDDRTPDGENKISTLERYKIKTNVSLGEIVELEHSVRDMREIACKLSYNLAMEPFRVDNSLMTSEDLMTRQLQEPQLTLLRWVFKPVISPKGLLYLPKPVIVQALGALEAILWARGHKYLAILASAYSLEDSKEMVISPVDSKMRVPIELTEELGRIYPFTRTVNAKKSQNKEINLSAAAIDTMTDNLCMYNWRSTASEEMLQEVLGNTSRKLPIKPDIKLDLTKLVIEIGSRSWT